MFNEDFYTHIIIIYYNSTCSTDITKVNLHFLQHLGLNFLFLLFIDLLFGTQCSNCDKNDTPYAFCILPCKYMSITIGCTSYI